MSAAYPATPVEKEAENWANELDATPHEMVTTILTLKDVLAVQDAKAREASTVYRKVAEEAERTAARIAALKVRLDAGL